MHQPTIDFVKQFCISNITCGLKALYLIGSQAKGTAGPKSDHDFIAVISDTCPPDLATAGMAWTKFFDMLNSQRLKLNLGPIDLFLKHEASFASSSTQNTVGHNPSRDAVTYGIKIA